MVNLSMKNNNQPVTKKELRETLGEFTDRVLLPAIKNIVDNRIDERVPKIIDEKNAKLVYTLKEYIDEKIADLRGDVIVLLRKDDRRFLHLVEILYQKKILDQKDIGIIEELQLFPRPVK